MRLSGVPHPHTWHIAEGMPTAAPELPLVLKPRFGSWGRDVSLCRTQVELDNELDRLRFRGWFREHGVLAQELVPPQGWDLRLIVAGGRVVGAARRTAAPGEWRTNVALGGVTEPTEPPPLARALALSAAAAIGADLVGVDLLPTETRLPDRRAERRGRLPARVLARRRGRLRERGGAAAARGARTPRVVRRRGVDL